MMLAWWAYAAIGAAQPALVLAVWWIGRRA